MESLCANFVVILVDLHVFSHPEYENVVFGILSLRVYGCAPRLRLNGWADFIPYSVFKSLSVICRCLVNMNDLCRKIGPPLVGPKTKWGFSRNRL
jgi:hypothetical protein